MKKARVEICVERSGKVPIFTYGYWWRFVGANGKIVCHSEQFATRSNALRAARRFLELAKNAEIVNE